MNFESKLLKRKEVLLRLSFGLVNIEIGSPLTFTDQFMELNMLYSSHGDSQFQFFGFGERRGDMVLGQHHWSHGVWNRDLPPMVNKNLYGDQPIWIAYNPSLEKVIGNIWWNSNAKSFEIIPLTSQTRLSIRSNGGIFDLFFVLDENPDQVVNTIHAILGPPTPMPVWSLGYQLCRWGYNSGNGFDLCTVGKQ